MKMRIDVVSGLPNLMKSPLEESIIKRAVEKGIVDIFIHDIREYATDKHKTIDDTPYGGGAGMILKVEPVYKCIQKLMSERIYNEIIYLSPAGEKFNQKIANKLSLQKNLLLLCGHYKGIDQRIIDLLVTKEISIGDYVLTGGELPALVIIDSLIRLIPGAIGDSESLLSDSFQDGLLDAPYYTKPAEFMGKKVPDELLSGDHKIIQKWKEKESLKITKERRRDLFENNYI